MNIANILAAWRGGTFCLKLFAQRGGPPWNSASSRSRWRGWRWAGRGSAQSCRSSRWSWTTCRSASPPSPAPSCSSRPCFSGSTRSKILLFELTCMFRWLGGNTRIVQIAKASSQSGSGGFRKVQKLFRMLFLPVQHEALTWDCPRTCLAPKMAQLPRMFPWKNKKKTFFFSTEIKKLNK